MSTDTDESSTLALGEINKYDFRTDTPTVFKARRGLDRDIVSQISEMKKEPTWMRDFRLKSLDIFNSKQMPNWGGNIGIDFQDIFYYLKPAEQQGKTWEEVPEEDLWEDGEADTTKVVIKMYSKVCRLGEWKLIRRKQ